MQACEGRQLKKNLDLKEALELAWQREDVYKASRQLDKTDLNKARGQEVAVGQVMSGGNDENSDTHMLLFLKEKMLSL